MKKHKKQKPSTQRKLKLVSLFSLLLAAAALPIAAQTNTPPSTPSVDLWTLSLGGGGLTTTSGDSRSSFNLSVQLGRQGTFPILLKLPTEFGLRQGINYNSANGGQTIWDTAVYYDLTVLRLFKDKLDLFVGPNFGVTYGNTPAAWRVAPEGGGRYWFRDNIAFLARIDYPYDLTHGRMQDILNYFLGLEVTF